MRRIQLHAIELEGFRSFRLRTLIEFSAGAGLKFLSGDNRQEPALGANGAGKSTVWDALTYCLFGTSVKGLKASALLSWGAEKLWVQTAWAVDDAIVVIERAGNPDRLLIDGTAAAQADVDRLIGLSRDRFLQSVVFGQAMPFFVDLAGPERGALLDSVLDLSVWAKAVDATSGRLQNLAKTMSGCERDIAHFAGQLEGIESEATIQAAMDAWQRDQNRRIEQAINAVESAEDDLARMKPLIVKTKAAVDALPTSQSMTKRLSMLQAEKASANAEYQHLFGQFQGAQRQTKFYQTNNVCGECGQGITRAYAKERIARMSTLVRDLESKIKMNTRVQQSASTGLQDLEDEVNKAARKREFLIEQRTRAVSDYGAQQRIVDGAVAAAEVMMEATNPHAARRDTLARDRALAQSNLDTARIVQDVTQTAVTRAEFWKAGFRRVRLFMVKRVLAQLQAETAAAAAALGLVGWTIAFSTELETKSGTIRPGIHIVVAGPATVPAPYEAWSGGEGQRIRLAVSLGLASMIQRMAGVLIMIEVWDEPGAWLSQEGVDHLVECLKHRVATTGKSLWISSHGAMQHGAFQERWLVSKDHAGSHLRLLSSEN